MTIKQKIWDKLEKDNYITDTELAKIYGREPNFYTAEAVKSEYFSFKKYKEMFASIASEKNTVIKKAGNRRKRYLIGKPKENKWSFVSSAYYSYLKSQGVKEI